MYTSNDYAADEDHSAAPRLDKEGEEKLVQRLYYRQLELIRQREEERMDTLRKTSSLSSTKKVSKEEEDKLVNRMYDQQLQRFAASKEEQTRKMNEEEKKKTMMLETSQIDDMVKRMYDDELAKGRARREELDQRFNPKQEPKVVPAKELQEAIDRLYHVDYEKKDEELFQKYVYPHDPKVVRISKDEVAAMADRLSTTKGSA